MNASVMFIPMIFIAGEHHVTFRHIQTNVHIILQKITFSEIQYFRCYLIYEIWDKRSWNWWILITQYKIISHIYLFFYSVYQTQIILSNFHLFFSSTFWFLMFIAGILGFLIGIVTVMQITYTSPLTHNISGTAKACVQTVFAFLIWKNPYTTNALLGVVLTIFGR